MLPHGEEEDETSAGLLKIYGSKTNEMCVK